MDSPRSIRRPFVMSVALPPFITLASAQAFATPNDTGQTSCYNATGTTASCTDMATPPQDARYGQDAGSGILIKFGAGAAGFDFTKICHSGEAAGEGSCPENPALGNSMDDWGCTRDNHTNLMWEVKTDDSTLRDKDWTYTWYSQTSHGGAPGTEDGSNNCFDPTRCDTAQYIADVNAEGLCGDTDWRLPHRHELNTLLHRGRNNPAIDSDYFPNTLPHLYATATAVSASHFLSIEFNEGVSLATPKSSATFVRLVRDLDLP